jgi:hypothetical protein
VIVPPHLPDMRVTHEDTLTHGENFSNKPGEMAAPHYRVQFSTPGRYYVRARAYSSGPEDSGCTIRAKSLTIPG